VRPPERGWQPSRLWAPGEGIGDIEGPHLAEGVTTRFRWCHAPSSKATFETKAAGTHLLLLEYQNIWVAGQKLSLLLDGRPLASYALRRTPRSSTRILAARADLAPGTHELDLRFSRWVDPGPGETRRLALMLNDIYVERLPAGGVSRPG